MFPSALLVSLTESEGFPGGASGKEKWVHLPMQDANAKDACWIFGSGRSPGGGLSNPLQYSCLENPMDRGA